jgi:aldose sugar dehydrogenase
LFCLHINKEVPQFPKVLLFTFLILSTFLTAGYLYYHHSFRVAAAQKEEVEDEPLEKANNVLPTVNDPNLKVEKVFEGLRFPTKMAFLGPNDILVLEKDNGTVQRIVNGKMLPEPILDVNVANKYERGMLGIAVAKHNNNDQQQQEQGNDASIGSSNSNNDSSGLVGVIGSSGSNSDADSSDNSNVAGTRPTYVFLYYTESKVEGSDICPAQGTTCNPAGEPFGNRLYRYELVDNKLVNPLLLLDLSSNHNRHNGGPVVIGPDHNVYLAIGDISHRTKAQNYKERKDADGTSGILRVTQDGQLVDNPPLGNDTIPLALYYAYGIRNSFGMDFDPITGNLWASEAGFVFDELNLVKPGFNGGWAKIDGIASMCKPGTCTYLRDSNVSSSPPSYLDSLEDFGGRGQYSDPQFVWAGNPTPTAAKFLNSDKLGKQYENELFVGDFNYGNLYHFKLNEDRTGLALDGPLADKVANSPNETKSILFGTGFGGPTALFIKKHTDIGGITDIEVGPDGYLYVLTFRQTQGAIFRIVPK